MNKKSFFSGLAIGLAGILAVGAAGWFTKGFRQWKKDEKPVIDNPIEESQEGGAYDENGNNLADGNIHDMPMKLTFTGAKTLASATNTDITENADGTKEVTVQATLNREVQMTFDWEVIWTDNTVTETLASYVTVTPESDGSAVAKVKMLQRFTNKITLTCASREITGLQAECAIDCTPEVNLDLYTASAKLGEEIGGTEENPSSLAFYETSEDAGYDFLMGKPDFTSLGTFQATDCAGKITIEFQNAENGDYGFRGILYDMPWSILQNNYVYRLCFYDHTYSESFRFTADVLKNAFYYGSDKTAEDFYSYGLALLQGLSSTATLKATLSIRFRSSETIFYTRSVYFKADVTNIEGLKIDINGMQDILF